MPSGGKWNSAASRHRAGIVENCNGDEGCWGSPKFSPKTKKRHHMEGRVQPNRKASSLELRQIVQRILQARNDGGDLSHWQLLAVADNFLPVDSHPVRPVHTTTLANDMTDKVLDEWLYTTCGNREKDRKKPFVLIKKKKLSLKWKRKH